MSTYQVSCGEVDLLFFLVLFFFFHLLCHLSSEPGHERQARRAAAAVVDDHPECLSSLQLLLELEGHRVTAASNAADALGELSNGHSFDLVITDFRMPGICGDELFKRARQLLGPLTPPFVLHSAHYDELSISETELPWDDCVPKGNPEQLRQCLCRFAEASLDPRV